MGVWRWLSAFDGFRPSQGLVLLVIIGIQNVSQGQTSLSWVSHPWVYTLTPPPLGNEPPSPPIWEESWGGCRIEPRGQHRTPPYLFS